MHELAVLLATLERTLWSGVSIPSQRFVDLVVAHFVAMAAGIGLYASVVEIQERRAWDWARSRNLTLPCRGLRLMKVRRLKTR